MQRVLVAALLGLVACGPDAKAPSKPNTAPLFYSTVEPSPGRRFPSPLVRGTVKGKETAFIVDTGAQVSVIDAKIAKEVGLPIQAGGEAYDPSGTSVAMSKTSEPSIVIDGLGPIPNRLVAVIDMPEVFRSIGIGGLLSPQMIAADGHQVVVDLTNRELRIDDPGAATRTSEKIFDLGPIQVCRYEDKGFAAASLIAQAVIDGVPTTIELDTGASNTFVVADSAIGRKLAARADGEHRKSVTAAGEADSARFQNITATLGEFDVGGPLMMMPGSRAGSCGYEGRIGIDRLKTCTLVIAQRDARATCSLAE